MIDCQARRELAQLIRRLAVGFITNDEFEDNEPISQEKALNDIFNYGVWPLYSDTHEHKLLGEYALSKQTKKDVARIILFLHSDFEYRWVMPDKEVWGVMSKLFFPSLILMILPEIIKFDFDIDYCIKLAIFYTFGFMFTTLIIAKICSNKFVKQNKDALDIWPFFSQEEYQYALQHPTYLAGKRN